MQIRYLSLLLLLPVAAHAAFSDVSIHSEYKAAIDYVHAKGIVSGYPDGTFGPTKPINRAEFTKIIVEAVYGTVEGSDCFPDVTDQWFAKYVCYAKEVGMIGGYPDGTFKPDRPVQFAEAAKIISNGFTLSGEGESAWYEPYVRALAGKKVIPLSITAFDLPITREEMAEMIYRLHAGDDKRSSKTYEQLAGLPAPRAPEVQQSKSEYPVRFPITQYWESGWQLQDIEKWRYPSDGTINVTYVEEPGGRETQFLRVTYPKGTKMSRSGVIPAGGVTAFGTRDVTPKEELYLHYRIRIPEHFDFERGGYLPGLYGGDKTGTGQGDGSFFFVGLTWKQHGEIGVYGSMTDDALKFSKERLAGKTDITKIWADSDAITNDGKWHTVDLHIMLNEGIRRENGIVTLYIDGAKAAESRQLRIRAGDSEKVEGIFFTSFFGEGAVSPSDDMYIDFTDFRISDEPMW